MMKKRLISCVSLLFAVCLLLCSCSAGMPGAALFSAAGDSLDSFSTKLENLILGNTPIILDAKSDFYIRTSVDASAEVRSAVKEFSDAIRAKTGVDIAASGKADATHGILIGNISVPSSKGVLDKLNAANFYIGFVGEDLVINAQNDIMLISALRYFVDVYIADAGANAATGYLFLPANLDFLSPTFVCSKEEFKFGRVANDDADWFTNHVVNDAYTRIVETTNVRLETTPYNMTQGLEQQKELLIGAVTREESKAILAALGDDQYYIGVVGNKVMVLAKNAMALRQGVNAFFATYLESEHAAYDTEARTWLLPTYCNYYGTVSATPR